MVGPAASSVTEIAGPIFDAADLAYVSPSATAVALTNGHLEHFFRVVANNNKQARAIVRLLKSSLHPKTVLIVDDREVYSTNLTKLIVQSLAKDHTNFDRVSVDVGQSNYGNVVDKIGPSTNVVVMPLVNPRDAQRLADQIHAAGKDPAIVGGDTMFSLNDFDVPRAYVPSYAPDVSKMADGAATVKLYSEIFGDLAPFAATAYEAMETVATAALQSCRNGQATRAGVTRALPGVRIPSTLLGNSVSFDRHHEAHRQPLLDVPDRRRDVPADLLSIPVSQWGSRRRSTATAIRRAPESAPTARRHTENQLPRTTGDPVGRGGTGEHERESHRVRRRQQR